MTPIYRFEDNAPLESKGIQKVRPLWGCDKSMADCDGATQSGRRWSFPFWWFLSPKEVEICLPLGRENIFTAYPAEVKK